MNESSHDPLDERNLRHHAVRLRNDPAERDRGLNALIGFVARTPEQAEAARVRFQGVLDGFDIKKLDLNSPAASDEIGNVARALEDLGSIDKRYDEAKVAAVLELYKVNPEDLTTVQGVRDLVIRALDNVCEGS